jgi:LAS superfamily LD-carboxypeptidase LdcB
MVDATLFSAQEMTGRARTHVVELADPRCTLHRDVVAPFMALRAAASADGIDLVPVSSFRDFARQLAIWNGKCRGERPLRDQDGKFLDTATLDEDALVASILIWSALPGASRHHWGTDMDVIDAAATPPEYVPQLVPEEYAPGGVYERLGGWLDANAGRFGFYRPYAVFRGGAQPEPWHLSYAPVAQAALQQFNVEMLREALAASDMAAAAAVQRQLPQIVQRYVMNVDVPPEAVSCATARA